MKLPERLLLFAGLLSFSVALFQAAVTFSPSWSRYFGAPDEVVSNVQLLYILGWAAAAFLAIFGLYAISGAGYIRPLPWLRPALLGIGMVYVLRGLWVTPTLLLMMGYVQSSEFIPTGAEPASSLVSLFIGLLYLTGTMGSWQALRIKQKPRAE